jgi:hypothetical protein
MKIHRHISVFLLAGFVLFSGSALLAGNNDRAGQAGASELLINPWARSSGWGNANSASIRGLEASFLNVAGTAFTKKTEMIFCRTNWLSGTDISINAFGLTQKVSESSVLGFNIMSMNLGDLITTTVDAPDGTLGSFNPQYLNIGLSYAREFSHSIYGGVNVKVITQDIPNVSAQGIAFDAGIQYVTGENDQIKFGIALKNVGPPMRFTGDGLSFRFTNPLVNAATPYETTVQQRSERFELPSLLNIGGAYDFKFTDDHKLTMAANFTSNSFTYDQYTVGAEYSFKSYLMLRGGYTLEQSGFSDADRTTALTGPAAGATFEVPLGKNGVTFGFDYSYRFTQPFNGSHSFSARIAL